MFLLSFVSDDNRSFGRMEQTFLLESLNLLVGLSTTKVPHELSRGDNVSVQFYKLHRELPDVVNPSPNELFREML